MYIIQWVSIERPLAVYDDLNERYVAGLSKSVAVIQQSVFISVVLCNHAALQYLHL